MFKTHIRNLAAVSAMSTLLVGCGGDALNQGEEEDNINPVIDSTPPQKTYRPGERPLGAHIMPIHRPSSSEVPPAAGAFNLQYYGGPQAPIDPVRRLPEKATLGRVRLGCGGCVPMHARFGKAREVSFRDFMPAKHA